MTDHIATLEELKRECAVLDPYGDKLRPEHAAALDAAIALMRGQSELVAFDPFAPTWPEGMKGDETYQLPCDDKGRDGGSWLRMCVAPDGDVWLTMMDWEDIKVEGTSPNPIPSIRCRTLNGGGRHMRTHQALLWLAQAIRLDTAPPAAKQERDDA